MPIVRMPLGQNLRTIVSSIIGEVRESRLRTKIVGSPKRPGAGHPSGLTRTKVI